MEFIGSPRTDDAFFFFFFFFFWGGGGVGNKPYKQKKQDQHASLRQQAAGHTNQQTSNYKQLVCTTSCQPKQQTGLTNEE
jgi:hypothetical protein